METTLQIFDQLVEEMERLLNCKLPHVHDSYKNGVDQRLGKIMRLYQDAQTSAKSGDNKTVEELQSLGRMEYLKMKMLRDNLRQIEGYSPDMLEEFRKRLRDPNYDNYFGTRMEVHIAANLIKQNINFERVPSSTKGQSPDFAVHWEDTSLYIECTNTHYSENASVTKPQPPDRKISDSIDVKAQKSYSGMNTVLFLDITDVHSHSTNENHISRSPTTFSDFVKEVPGYANLGSVILFTYNFDPGNNVYSSGFTREDNQSITSELKSFLDKHFFGKGIVLEDSLVPFDV